MLRALLRRRFVPGLALVMQLCMAWLSIAALVHNEDDDAICNPVVVLHDHNAHHIGASTETSPTPEHCFICHTLSLRSLIATVGVAVPAVDSQSVPAVPDIVADVTLVAWRPARAPPLA